MILSGKCAASGTTTWGGGVRNVGGVLTVLSGGGDLGGTDGHRKLGAIIGDRTSGVTLSG